MHSMNIRKATALVGVAMLAMTINVVASILYMVVYGHWIAPGHDASYYHDHIQVAGPYCSIVAGMPIMWLTGYWVAGFWQRSLGMLGPVTVWIAYAVIDLMLLLMVGMTVGVAVLFVVSFATKFAALFLGARLRLRKRT